MTTKSPADWQAELRALFEQQDRIIVHKQHAEIAERSLRESLSQTVNIKTKCIADLSEVRAAIGKLKHRMDLAGIPYPPPAQEIPGQTTLETSP